MMSQIPKLEKTSPNSHNVRPFETCSTFNQQHMFANEQYKDAYQYLTSSLIINENRTDCILKTNGSLLQVCADVALASWIFSLDYSQ